MKNTFKIDAERIFDVHEGLGMWLNINNWLENIFKGFYSFIENF